MQMREFLLQARLKTEVLNVWLEAGWLQPQHDGRNGFSEVDLARAQLIRDLQQMGVNEEAVPIVLDLIDQVHGLRRTMRTLLLDAAARHARAD